MQKTIDIEIFQGSKYREVFIWVDDNEQPIDLSGYTAKMQIRTRKDRNSLIIHSVDDINIYPESGAVEPIIDSQETRGLDFIWAYYDLILIPPSGSNDQIRLLQGRVYFNKAVTDIDIIKNSAVHYVSFSIKISGHVEVEGTIDKYPVVSDPELTVTLTETGYRVDFVKATDPAGSEPGTPQEELDYFLVEGTELDLSDRDLIQELTPVAADTDVDFFEVVRSSGFFSIINIYVSDENGNISLYELTDIFVPDEEVLDIKIYDRDPDAITAEPIASFQNSGSLKLSSQNPTIRLYLRADASGGAEDTVTVTSSNLTKLSITVIDDYTIDITQETYDSGEIVNIIAESDFDSSFKAILEVELLTDLDVDNVTSDAHVMETT